MKMLHKIGGIVFLSTSLLTADLYTSFGVQNRPGISPEFTSPSVYNSYDFCGFPTGLFEKDTFLFKAKLGVETDNWHATENSDSLVQKYNSFILPELSVSVPKTFIFQIKYNPQTISADQYGQELSLPLQTFGLNFAVQIPSEKFKLSLKLNGFTGNEKITAKTQLGGIFSNSPHRIILGTDDVSLAIGSRIHPLFELGMSGGFNAKLDTLVFEKNTGLLSLLNTTDRYFETTLPKLSWYIDFGNHSFPVESDILLTTETDHFVYVSALNIDQNPIKSKNLLWKWNTIGNIVSDPLIVHPAINVGYWKNDVQVYKPTESNDNLDVGDEISGYNWKLSNFFFGAGVSVNPVKCVNLWCEYTNSSLALKKGDFFLNNDREDHYHSTQTGIAFDFHKVKQFNFPSSIETTLKSGFSNRTENLRQYTLTNSLYNKLYPATASQMYRYIPDSDWETVRVSEFSFGIYASFLKKALELESSINIQNQTMHVEKSGAHFDLTLTYNLRK